jgi:hypothetical protein
MQSDLAIDDQLINILDSAIGIVLPNTQIRSGTTLRAQMAAAIAVGYRGRFSLPEAASENDGIYVAVNYDVLRGLRYEDLGVGLRLDTDLFGLLTVNSQLPAPLSINRDHATSGWGRAIDVGVGVVLNEWEVGFGANGMANRIDWRDVVRTTYSLANPFNGNATFVERSQPAADARVTLPVGYTAQVGYNAASWSGIGDVRWGLGGKALHGGYEYRFRAIELRAGAIYGRQLWSPTAGVGFNISPHTALDVGLYGNAANAERKRHPAVAVSVRLRSPPKQSLGG